MTLQDRGKPLRLPCLQRLDDLVVIGHGRRERFLRKMGPQPVPADAEEQCVVDRRQKRIARRGDDPLVDFAVHRKRGVQIASLGRRQHADDAEI